MPPRRRRDGPPPGGHTQLPDIKRSRDRADLESDEPASKRHQASTPSQSYKKPFGFDSTRNPSFIRSAPGNLTRAKRDRSDRLVNGTPTRNIFGSQRRSHSIRSSKLLADSPFNDANLHPTSESSSEENKTHENSTSQNSEAANEPQTPTPNTPSRGLMGMISNSASAMLSYITGTPQARPGGSLEKTNGNELRNEEIHQEEPLTPQENDDILDASDESPTVRKDDRRSTNVLSASSPIKAYSRGEAEEAIPNGEENADQEHHDGINDSSSQLEFETEEIPGSKKRKLVSVNGTIPRPQNGGYGIDESYLDQDNFVEGIDETNGNELTQPATPPAKRQKTLMQTPLKSSMKRPGIAFNGTAPRSAKSVKIDLTRSSSKLIYGQYGRAGDYRGSTFSDSNSFSSPSSISLNATSFQSPATLNNTSNNMDSIFRFNSAEKDPNDRNWRPSLANPKPGHFRVPDLDEEDDEDLSFNDDTTIIQPNTPRISHAELPTTATSTSNTTGDPEDVLADTTELKLNKARSEAQRYKPKDSSRLSLVEQARSRSSSPPSSVTALADDLQDGNSLHDSDKENSVPTNGVSKKTTVKPKVLDNTIVGEDGMTEYEREHQYDEWARNLDWPEPQTYEESGVGSAYITKLIRDRWTEDDSRRSHEFWQKEFDEVDKAMNEAKARGLILELITEAE